MTMVTYIWISISCHNGHYRFIYINPFRSSCYIIVGVLNDWGNISLYKYFYSDSRRAGIILSGAICSHNKQL